MVGDVVGYGVGGVGGDDFMGYGFYLGEGVFYCHAAGGYLHHGYVVAVIAKHYQLLCAHLGLHALHGGCLAHAGGIDFEQSGVGVEDVVVKHRRAIHFGFHLLVHRAQALIVLHRKNEHGIGCALLVGRRIETFDFVMPLLFISEIWDILLS